MVKASYVIGIIVIIIIAALAGGYFYITGSSTRPAFLNVELQTVQVDTGSGYETAVDGMKLSENDKVKTLDGEATIVLYESTMVSLEPNTEVSITDLDAIKVALEQNSGATWNKFTGITGLVEFSISTPTTVATVRGTEFGLDMMGVIVAEGVVEVVVGGETFRLTAEKKIVLRDGEWVEEDITPEDRQKIVAHMGDTLKMMKEIRWEEVNKKQLVYNQLKEQYELSDQDVIDYLDRADNGEFDLDEVEAGAPDSVKKIESAQKIKAMTEEIIKQNKAIEVLQR
jgi:hypothetical protein